MKLKGSIHFLRSEIEREKTLNDAETRLFRAYWVLCVWDSRKENFGTSEISINGIREHLPWSVGKVSETRSSLTKKGWLKRVSKTRFGIKDADKYYRKNIRDLEIAFQNTEIHLRSPEEIIRLIEEKRKMIGSMSTPDQPIKPIETLDSFQPIEKGITSKETVKKDKETIKKDDFNNSPTTTTEPSKGNEGRYEHRTDPWNDSKRPLVGPFEKKGDNIHPR